MCENHHWKSAPQIQSAQTSFNKHSHVLSNFVLIQEKNYIISVNIIIIIMS